MASEDVSLRLTLKDEASAAMRSASSGIASSLKGIVAGFASLEAGRRIIQNAVRETVEWERATRGLRGALLATGQAARQTEVEQLAGQLQLVTDATDDVIAQLFATAVAAGRTTDELKDMAQAARILSALTGDTFAQSFETLTRALAGVAPRVGAARVLFKDLTAAQLENNGATYLLLTQYADMETRLSSLETAQNRFKAATENAAQVLGSFFELYLDKVDEAIKKQQMWKMPLGWLGLAGTASIVQQMGGGAERGGAAATGDFLTAAEKRLMSAADANYRTEQERIAKERVDAERKALAAAKELLQVRLDEIAAFGQAAGVGAGIQGRPLGLAIPPGVITGAQPGADMEQFEAERQAWLDAMQKGAEGMGNYQRAAEGAVAGMFQSITSGFLFARGEAMSFFDVVGYGFRQLAADILAQLAQKAAGGIVGFVGGLFGLATTPPVVAEASTRAGVRQIAPEMRRTTARGF